MSTPEIRPTTPHTNVYFEVVKVFSQQSNFIFFTPGSLVFWQMREPYASHVYVPLPSPPKSKPEAPRNNAPGTMPILPKNFVMPKLIGPNPTPAEALPQADKSIIPRNFLQNTFFDFPFVMTTVKFILDIIKQDPQIFSKSTLVFEKPPVEAKDKVPVQPPLNIQTREGKTSILSTQQPLVTAVVETIEHPIHPDLRHENFSFMSKESPQPLPAITSSAEIAPLVKQFSNQIPLTFIVPYPFDHKIGNAVGKGSAAEKGKKAGGQNSKTDPDDERQVFAFVPKGPLILDDGTTIEIESFAIATTSVTNGQFCIWLNEMLLTRQVTFASGEVKDLEGNLLCLTQEKVATSQIHTTFVDGHLFFTPVRHADRHPIVHVTYLGALAYCLFNGVRLPTTNEWERAASMKGTKKCTYGFAKDEINPSYANYKEVFTNPKPLENRTTPVNFFNGESVFAQGYETIQTKKALSPFGCYDMSGNVWEWTQEEIAKGGCYNSTQQDLKVSAYMIPLHCDAFTGFRVALTIKST